MPNEPNNLPIFAGGEGCESLEELNSSEELIDAEAQEGFGNSILPIFN